MLRKILLFIIFLMTVSSLFLFHQKYFEIESIPENNFFEQKQEEFKQLPEIIDKKNEVPDFIKQLNNKFNLIKSISCDNIELILWQNGHKFRLNGSLHYEKSNNFRMEISSFLGKELDIGSNSSNFWYWSRRDKSPGLHYASHDDLNKTRLKTPFNPFFLRSTLGISELEIENCKIVENSNNFMLCYKKLNASDESINFYVFISKNRNQIDSYAITDFGGKPVASCEIQQYNGDIPFKILYTWNEENRVMLMQMNNATLNNSIDSKKWSMPNYKPITNMAESD